MPATAALIICALCVVVAFRTDATARGSVSAALWIPTLWLAIRGSRPVTYWLGNFGGGGADEIDGSPIDRWITLILFAAAFVVLRRRRVTLSRVAGTNALLLLVLLYFLCSTAWAPYPLVALKRIFKEAGALFIIWVILTEPDPFLALRVVLVRCAYLLFPISLVLINYYPELGRAYTPSGEPMVTGITMQKNSLGQICCIFGLALLLDILATGRNPCFRRSLFTVIRWSTFLCGLWLLRLSHSATALVATSLGTTVLLFPRIPFVRSRQPTTAIVLLLSTTFSLFILAFSTVLMEPILGALGRDATFTGRTKIWQVVLDQDTNPLIGAGFYSFWLESASSVHAEFTGMQTSVAHNGYLETFLDGGIIGLVLVVGLLLQTSFRMAASLSADDPHLRYGFAMTLLSVLMNYSESYFLRLGPLWFNFLFFAVVSSAFCRTGFAAFHEGAPSLHATGPASAAGREPSGSPLNLG